MSSMSNKNSKTFTIRPALWSEDISLLRAVRETVFVQEQKVPIELEWDDMDACSEHVLALDNTGLPIGTGRLLPDGHIGRMAVLKEWRGQGVGGGLLHVLLASARGKAYPQAMLNAQLTAVPFYQKYGFCAQGKEFDEAGIPHIGMVLNLS